MSAKRYYGLDMAPIGTSTFSAVTTLDGEIIVTFAWIPPEATSDTHIVSRVSMGKAMAKHLSEVLARTIESNESKSKVKGKTKSNQAKNVDEPREKNDVSTWHIH
jgi:hypothetical protein